MYKLKLSLSQSLLPRGNKNQTGQFLHISTERFSVFDLVVFIL